MCSLNALVILLVPFASCFLYINRTSSDNSAAASVTVKYTHDVTGNCVVNVTFVTAVAITNMRIYFKISLPENHSDRDFRRVLVSSVVEFEKVFKGMQSNLIINAFFSAIRKSMDFEYKTPLPPVSRNESDNFVISAFKYILLHGFHAGNLQISKFQIGNFAWLFSPWPRWNRWLAFRWKNKSKHQN